jgi:hypothetical protein
MNNTSASVLILAHRRCRNHHRPVRSTPIQACGVSPGAHPADL